jgi:hypothetical protein
MLAMTCKSSNNPNEALTNRPIMNPERAISAAFTAGSMNIPIHNTADTTDDYQSQKRLSHQSERVLKEGRKKKGAGTRPRIILHMIYLSEAPLLPFQYEQIASNHSGACRKNKTDATTLVSLVLVLFSGLDGCIG